MNKETGYVKKNVNLLNILMWINNENPVLTKINSSYLLNLLAWDKLSIRRAKLLANLMYQCVINLAPDYLCNMLNPRV